MLEPLRKRLKDLFEPVTFRKLKSSVPTETSLRETARRQQQRLRDLKQNTLQQNSESKRKMKKKAAPKTTVEYLDYERMYDNGICELGDDQFSITLKISDINYQTARRDEQMDIFGRYCEVLNSLDPQQHFQISIIDRRIDKDEFRRNMLLPLSNDKYDEYRNVMNDILSAYQTIEK